MYRATPVDNTEPCHRLSARNSRLSAPDALIGRVYAGGSSRWSERKRPVVAVPGTKPAPATTGRLYVGAWRKLLAWRRNSRPPAAGRGCGGAAGVVAVMVAADELQLLLARELLWRA